MLQAVVVNRDLGVLVGMFVVTIVVVVVVAATVVGRWRDTHSTRHASSAAKLAKLRLCSTKLARSLLPPYSETKVATVSLRGHPGAWTP